MFAQSVLGVVPTGTNANSTKHSSAIQQRLFLKKVLRFLCWNEWLLNKLLDGFIVVTVLIGAVVLGAVVKEEIPLRRLWYLIRNVLNVHECSSKFLAKLCDVDLRTRKSI